MYIVVLTIDNQVVAKVDQQFVASLKRIFLKVINNRLYGFNTVNEANEFISGLYDLGSSSNWNYKIVRISN